MIFYRTVWISDICPALTARLKNHFTAHSFTVPNIISPEKEKNKKGVWKTYKLVTVQPECCVERRTHGRDFFAGRRQRECLSRFSVRFFRLGVSKQNGISFLRLRDALKRHPCRIGLNRASVHGFPYVSAFC